MKAKPDLEEDEITCPYCHSGVDDIIEDDGGYSLTAKGVEVELTLYLCMKCYRRF